MQLLVILAGAAVFVAAFMSLRPLVLKLASHDVARADAVPIPPRWRPILAAAVPQSRRLPPIDQERWLRRTRELITTSRWEGCGGLRLTEEMQLSVAGQASLLALGLGAESYRRFREVLLYPRTFLATRVCDPLAARSGDNVDVAPPELGEAWKNGTVVLSWESARDGGIDPHDGRNVVYHEFAHQIDYDHGLTADPPASVARSFVPDVPAWTRALTEGYRQLAATSAARTPSVLDAYGTTNLAEFFAVATEAFFERPADLSREYPALFAQLKTIYRQDPETWS